MSTYNFHLLVNQHGERFIFYNSPNGEKVIEDFAKIPYTAESLFEDIKDEFSAFVWMNQIDKLVYVDIGISIGLPTINAYIDDWCEEYYLKHYFKEIICVMVGDEAIYSELYILQMNDNEKKLFGELKDYLTTYCQDNNMELCIWDEAVEKAK
jgi:hypothetical protein